MIAGTLGGVLSTVVGYPLDTIRIRMQYQIIKKGILENFKQAIKNESIFSIFRGIESPLLI